MLCLQNPDKAKKPGQPAAKRRRASSELSDNDVIYMGSDNIAPHQPSDDAGLTTNHKTNEGPLGQATQCIVRPEVSTPDLLKKKELWALCQCICPCAACSNSSKELEQVKLQTPASYVASPVSVCLAACTLLLNVRRRRVICCVGPGSRPPHASQA